MLSVQTHFLRMNAHQPLHDGQYWCVQSPGGKVVGGLLGKLCGWLWVCGARWIVEWVALAMLGWVCGLRSALVC